MILLLICFATPTYADNSNDMKPDQYTSNYNIHRTNKEHDKAANILVGGMISMTMGGLTMVGIYDKWSEIKEYILKKFHSMQYPIPDRKL